MRIIFADLDGTILDQDNYSREKSSEGISIIKKTGIPLILASAKTRSEMILVSGELDINFPFIFENGSGIDFRGSRLMLSPHLERLKEALSLLTADGLNIKPVTEMSLNEVMFHTGLSEENARMARMREGSLPFIIEKENISVKDRAERLNFLLEGSGFKVVKGTRFYHLISDKVDKAAAMKEVVSFYEKMAPEEKIFSAAIGDGENDIPMLQSADTAFFVGPEPLSGGLPEGILFTEKKGPEGFTEAVKRIIG